VGECALVFSIYPLRKAICFLCQVETSVVWFFPFKRTWSPSFDTLKLFGDFLGGGLNSVFFILKLLVLIPNSNSNSKIFEPYSKIRSDSMCTLHIL
jgi:hypothetical protein